MDRLKSNGHILSICKIHPSRIACSLFFPYSGGHNEAFSPGRYPVSSNFFYLFFLPRYCKYFQNCSYTVEPKIYKSYKNEFDSIYIYISDGRYFESIDMYWYRYQRVIVSIQAVSVRKSIDILVSISASKRKLLLE